MLEISSARNGEHIFYADGKVLNSKYDPTAEARQFIERNISHTETGILLIVGETFGYLSREAKRLNPGRQIISVYLSSAFRPYADDRLENYYADDEDDILAITKFIDEYNVESVSILAWTPCMRTWPENGNRAMESIRSAVRRATGNLTTTIGFGRKWLSNLVQNIVDLPFTVTNIAAKKPILIAASGPSLENVIEDTALPIDQIEVWALPSSLHALEKKGIEPTVIISTDPGMYAALHYRGISLFPNAVTVYPLTAFPGIPLHSERVSVIDQQSEFESAFFASVSLPRIRVPANGTVAGTAYHLAVRQRVPVFLAGLDFSTFRSLEHARPHPFLDIRERRATRTSPLLSQQLETIYTRYPIRLGINHRTNQPLSTYADWFHAQIGTPDHSHVHRISPSPLTGDDVQIGTNEILGIIRRFNNAKTKSSISVSSVTWPVRMQSVTELLGYYQRMLLARLTENIDDDRYYFTPHSRVADRIAYLLSARKILSSRKFFAMQDRPRAVEKYRAALDDASSFIARQIRRINGVSAT